MYSNFYLRKILFKKSDVLSIWIDLAPASRMPSRTDYIVLYFTVSLCIQNKSNQYKLWGFLFNKIL